MCMSLGKTPSQTKFGNKQGDWLKTAWKANPITLKPETAGCMAERLSWPSLPYLLSAKVPLPNSLLLCQYVWLHSSFLSVRQELSLVVSEKAMAPHSSTLAWKIPWMEEPDRLQSMGSWSVRHNWTTSLSRTGEGNGNSLQCSCLENPRDGGAWSAAISGVAQSWTWLKRLSSSSSSNLVLWKGSFFLQQL